ncbi:MAG: hypothetical protein R3B33_15655 [Nitrospirales bacterium]
MAKRKEEAMMFRETQQRHHLTHMLRSYWSIVVLMGMLLGAMPSAASAHVEMQLDPFGEAQDTGLPILDLRRVTVAILGSDHVNPRDVDKKTLRLGSRNTVGASPKYFAKRLRDVNDDGFPDRLAVFEISETGLSEGDLDAVLTGNLTDGTQFIAYGSIVQSTDPISYCIALENAQNGIGIAGIRCSYTSSYDSTSTPLDWPNLILDINSLLESEGSTDTVDSTTPVIVETWGGAGHEGETQNNCGHKEKGGAGGARGYGRTVQTVQDITDLLPDGTNMYLYAAEDGPVYQDGGSASLLVGKAITEISSDTSTPHEANVLVIAGGGGGGGKGHCVGTTVKGGYSGGSAGIAIATTAQAGNAAGDDGANSDAGHGGNKDGNGTAGVPGDGSGHGDAGTNGIGGFGSPKDDAGAGWTGSTLTDTDWPNGMGGEGGNTGAAGGGGGGYGGGGGARSGDHNGGGGGGGSWARTEAIDESELDDDLIQGSSYDPGQGTVVLTFQLLPLNE